MIVGFYSRPELSKPSGIIVLQIIPFFPTISKDNKPGINLHYPR